MGDASGTSQIIPALSALGGVVIGSLISWGAQAWAARTAHNG